MENFSDVFFQPETYRSIYIFLLGMILKILMDLNLGKIVVKYCYWLSLRAIFRVKPIKISGIYRQCWDFNSNRSYTSKSDRQSLVTIKQLNNYCYAEFQSKNESYYLFGEIIDRRIIGHWGDVNNRLGYFGSFELNIINTSCIEGNWIGHSDKNPNIINSYKWAFKAVTDNTRYLVVVKSLLIIKRMKRKFLYLIWTKDTMILSIFGK